MSDEVRIVSWADTKEIYDEETGEQKTVPMFLPECCREGWKNCPHVINRDERTDKTNLGL